MRYLGVDPGLNSTGWATLDPVGLKFGAVRPPRGALYARVKHVLNGLPERWRVDAVCVERMIFRGENSKGSAQGLIDLSVLVGAVTGWYAAESLVKLAAPHEWKGSLPAQVLLDRLLSEHSQVLTHAQKIELSTMPGKLDAAAAIGIVRFAAGLPLT